MQRVTLSTWGAEEQSLWRNGISAEQGAFGEVNLAKVMASGGVEGEEFSRRKNSQDKSEGIRRVLEGNKQDAGGEGTGIFKATVSHVVLVAPFKATCLPHLLILGKKGERR